MPSRTPGKSHVHRANGIRFNVSSHRLYRYTEKRSKQPVLFGMPGKAATGWLPLTVERAAA